MNSGLLRKIDALQKEVNSLRLKVPGRDETGVAFGEKKDPVNDRVLEQNYFLDSFFSFLASRFSFKVFAGAFLVCFSTWRSLAMFIS